MSETPTTQSEPVAPRPESAAVNRYRPRKRHVLTALAAVVLIGAGAAAGATAIKATRPAAEMAPVTPIAISSLSDTGIVSIKGQVAEVFGNKFIISDGSGRALVETGPAGEGGKLVAMSEPVTVQGRFENGFLHASFVVHGDGKIETLGPVGPPHGPGPREPHGPGARPGPKDGPRPLADAGPDGEAGPHADRGPAGSAGPDAPAPVLPPVADQPAPPAAADRPAPPQP